MLTASKWVLTRRLKVSKLLDILMSRGTVFHNLAADTENEFSYKDVLKLGIRNDSWSTERLFLLWVSKTFVNRSFMYSGARLLKAL